MEHCEHKDEYMQLVDAVCGDQGHLALRITSRRRKVIDFHHHHRTLGSMLLCNVGLTLLTQKSSAGPAPAKNRRWLTSSPGYQRSLRRPSPPPLLPSALGLHGSMTLPAFSGMHILAMGDCPTARSREMKPISISSASDQREKREKKRISARELNRVHVL